MATTCSQRRLTQPGHLFSQIRILIVNSNGGIGLVVTICSQRQSSHRLEKYLNLEGFLEKALKVKSAMKSTGNNSKTLKRP